MKKLFGVLRFIICSSLDWEKIEIIDKLYKIFQGTVVAPGNSKQVNSVLLQLCIETDFF